jgi:hypothetical protein
MSVNGENGETTPQPVIQHPANRELVTFLGNLVMESQNHYSGLRALYEMTRDWTGIVPRPWVFKLIEEEERHIDRSAAHVTALKLSFG